MTVALLVLRHVQGDLCVGLTVEDESGSEGEVEGVLGLRDFLAKPVSNRFKQSFRHGTFPRRLLGCSGQVGTTW